MPTVDSIQGRFIGYLLLWLVVVGIALLVSKLRKKLGEQAKRPIDKKFRDQAKPPIDKKPKPLPFGVATLLIGILWVIELPLLLCLHLQLDRTPYELGQLVVVWGTPGGGAVLLGFFLWRDAKRKLAKKQPE